jgi:hypothetical protein
MPSHMNGRGPPSVTRRTSSLSIWTAKTGAEAHRASSVRRWARSTKPDGGGAHRGGRSGLPAPPSDRRLSDRRSREDHRVGERGFLHRVITISGICFDNPDENLLLHFIDGRAKKSRDGRCHGRALRNVLERRMTGQMSPSEVATIEGELRRIR